MSLENDDVSEYVNRRKAVVRYMGSKNDCQTSFLRSPSGVRELGSVELPSTTGSSRSRRLICVWMLSLEYSQKTVSVVGYLLVLGHTLLGLASF